MIWLRRIAAVPLFLLAFVCAVGAVRSVAGNLPGSGFGGGIFYALVAAAFGAGVYFLLRPDLRRLRGLSRAQVRRWLLKNPLGQAILLYAAAVIKPTREAPRREKVWRFVVAPRPFGEAPQDQLCIS